MTRRAGCYEPERLNLLLESRLDEQEETAITRHLDRCEACRTALETLAADTTEWDAMRELLRAARPDDGDFAWGESDRDEESPGAATAFLPLTFLAPADDPAFLGRIGPYEVTGVVGRGGMSVVLKAFDRPLNRNVAVKVLAPQLAASAAARRRFAREARAAAAVVHEHVIPIHSVAEHAGLPYLVMPYYPGRSLQRRIDDSGPLAVVEVLRIARQVAAGLAAAHAQGLVHRDVKPANILLENGVERAVVSDFGLARAIDDASMTCSGTIAGTPQYMAPEQARGEPVDHRADLFSLGSVIYAMCAGRPPFRAETTLGVIRRVCDDEPRPLREINPDVPAWLADVVRKLHAKNPADRFRDAREVEAALERGLAHLQNPTAAPEPPRLFAEPRDAKTTRKSRLRTALLATAPILLTALGLAWHFNPAGHSPSVPRSAWDRTGATPRVAGGEPHPQENRSTPVETAAPPASAPEPDPAVLHAELQRIESAWSDATEPPADLWNDIPQLRLRAARLAEELRGNEF